MESSFLIEVDNTSILRTGALHCYHYTLNRLPAPRLLLPRSGLERSDFVQWPVRDIPTSTVNVCSVGHFGSPVSARSGPLMVESECDAVALGSNISVFRLFRLAVP